MRLEQLYASGQGANGGVQRLYRLAKGYGYTLAQVKAFLETSNAYTRNVPIRKKFTRRKTMVAGPRQQFQLDLIDLSKFQAANDGYHWILMVIDAFTRELRMYPLLNKTGRAVSTALRQMIEVDEFTALKFQSDRGGEFYNREVAALLEQHNIILFSTRTTDAKASIVERVNRTILNDLTHAMTRLRTERYLELIPEIQDQYNTRFHTTLKMSPNAARNLVRTAARNIYSKRLKKSKIKYRVGEFVRTMLQRRLFSKGYEIKWSREIFRITQVRGTRPVEYAIAALDDTEIDGWWYQEELTRVSEPEIYEIEQVLNRRGQGRNEEVYVKWLGYGDQHNSWIPAANIQGG